MELENNKRITKTPPRVRAMLNNMDAVKQMTGTITDNKTNTYAETIKKNEERLRVLEGETKKTTTGISINDLPENVVVNISTNLIDPYEFQVRKGFDESELLELSEDIKKRGLLNPIKVIPKENGRFEVYAGERRLKACIMAEVGEIACFISKNKDKALIDSFQDNEKRADLNFLNKGFYFQMLIDKGIAVDIAEIQEILNIKNQATIYEPLRMLKSLNQEEANDLLSRPKLSRGDLRSYIKKRDKSNQVKTSEVLKISLLFKGDKSNLKDLEKLDDIQLTLIANKVSELLEIC